MTKTLKNTAAVVALMAGFALPSAAMATIYTNDTDVAIPAEGSVSSDIVIADAGSIASITVEAGIDHTWIGDLLITLESADGTEIVLMDRPGVPASTFGNSDDLSAGNPLIFDDASLVAAETANGGGTYGPDDALASLFGESLAGTWTLHIEDLAGGDAGLLDYWSLNINWEIVDAPEPAALGLMGLGLVGMGFAARRRKA
ncbi:proprotein convertase P-domain-containing protein [Emcibacter nanhaiensis]|uniref:PEP-CTERM sorting domain-containing protein n=1 Tax=Emcibacter nanhaiensis TaxID=1505037 RepID=A0A501PSZ4_9PROT|nr:proprotein convertase P-domain-containing protein [Emcibacter nanhaiensis]TPD63268.1 PEP-CTERM sorting domain-containing protein [Emcibacter nanhaiensis]